MARIRLGDLRTLGFVPPGLRVGAAEWRTSETSEQARDPDGSAVAPAMTIELVRPLVVNQAAATTRGWGTGAAGAADTPFYGRGGDVAVLDTGIDGSHHAFRTAPLVENDLADAARTRSGADRGSRRPIAGKVIRDEEKRTSEFSFADLVPICCPGWEVASWNLLAQAPP